MQQYFKLDHFKDDKANWSKKFCQDKSVNTWRQRRIFIFQSKVDLQLMFPKRTDHAQCLRVHF